MFNRKLKAQIKELEDKIDKLSTDLVNERHRLVSVLDENKKLSVENSELTKANNELKNKFREQAEWE